MKAAIFTIDTGKYKAKAESAAATALKRMLVQVGFEVKAAGVLPQEKEVLASVIRQLADPHDRIRGISGERLCTGCGDRDGGPSPARDPGSAESL